MGPLVHFDEHNPASEKWDKTKPPSDALDYSPLPRISWRVVVVGMFVSMGGMIFGYDTGSISGFLRMPDYLERFGELGDDGTYFFSNVRSGLIVGLLSIGTLIGALASAPMADRIGRKYSITVGSIIVAVGFVIQVASSHSWIQIGMGRWVAGLGIGSLSLTVPMYMTETAPQWIRGAMVCTYQLFITFGIFLAACINYGSVSHLTGSVQWRMIIGIGWLYTLVLGIGILFFPETPRYDYAKGNYDRARETLMRVYNAPANHWSIVSQIDEIEAKLRAEENIVKLSAAREFVGMFSAPRMAYRIALGVGLQMFQQLSGANYFFYYGTTIFASVNIDSYITQIILNTINFLATFAGLWLVENYGRRKSLIGGSLWMGTCFLIFASVGHFALDQEHPQSTRSAGICLIVFAALFVCGFAITWGPIVWAAMSEMMPSRYRAQASALGTASNWLWSFMLAFFTPFITQAIDFRYGYIFASTNFVAAAMVFFFLMESQGRTLEEVDTMYIDHVNPLKSSSWIAPPPKEMAAIRKAAGTDLEVGLAEHSEVPTGGPLESDESTPVDSSAASQHKTEA